MLDSSTLQKQIRQCAMGDIMSKGHGREKLSDLGGGRLM